MKWLGFLSKLFAYSKLDDTWRDTSKSNVEVIA